MTIEDDGSTHAPQCMCDLHDSPAIEAERAELAASGITIGKAYVRRRPGLPTPPAAGHVRTREEYKARPSELRAYFATPAPAPKLSRLQRIKAWFRRD